MSGRAWVVANPRARGLGGDRTRLEEAARAVAPDVVVRWCEEGGDVPRHAREALDAGAGTVVAAGGDGTVSGVASVLSGSGVPLGVMPLGTLNHFAKDLGLPTELGDAARVALAGRVARVDVGDVSGRTFVNTAAFGRYFEVVQLREAWSGRWGKWPAFVAALLAVLARSRFTTHLEAALDGARGVPATEAWIGCGDYDLAPPDLARRSALGTGRLTVTLQLAPGRMSLLRSAGHVLTGRTHESALVDLRHAQELVVRSTRGRELRCVLDGEPSLRGPEVLVRVREGALAVRTP